MTDEYGISFSVNEMKSQRQSYRCETCPEKSIGGKFCGLSFNGTGNRAFRVLQTLGTKIFRNSIHLRKIRVVC